MSRIEAILSRKRAASPSNRSSTSLLIGCSKKSNDKDNYGCIYRDDIPPSKVPKTNVDITSDNVPGIPRAAPATQLTAPVHIDVGGTSYTSTLETLTK